MIFVTVGTYEMPFDRLVGAVAALPREEELVVQHGPSTIRPEASVCDAYLPFEAVVARMREARVVITHAGVGSVLSSLSAGKRPIVVPRQSRFGEIVDDHQIVFARRLAQTRLVEVVDDLDELPHAVRSHSPASDAHAIDSSRLAAELGSWIDLELSDAGKRRPRRRAWQTAE